jgi:hypothetical protein
MMRNQGYLTEEAYQEALAQELTFKSGIAPEDAWVYCDSETCDYQGTVSTLTKKKSNYYLQVFLHPIRRLILT